MKKNDLAFPMQGYHLGLTKREYFTAMAMQGLLACNVGYSLTQVAEYALQNAEATLTLLEKVEKEEQQKSRNEK